MLIENVEEFSLWLINELTGLSEADPETLSKYVIALLKKDKSEKSLREICVDQLNVFLAEKTKKFIDDVFDCLKHKKFSMKKENVKSIENERISKSSERKLEKSQFKISPSDEEVIPSDQRKYSPTTKIKSSDEEEKRNSDNRSYLKRSRERSSYKSHEDRKKKRYNDDVDTKDKRYHSGRHKSHRSKKNVFDRIDYRHKYLERTDDSKLIDYSYEKQIWDIKTSCPDFVEKGVCLKGDSCEFDHGLNVVRSDINCIYSGASMPQNTVNSNWQTIPVNQAWVDKFSVSKPIQNIVPLKTIENNSYSINSTQDSNNNKNAGDIYDPSHPEIDANCENDNKKNRVVNDSAPVYVPSQVENNQKESIWYKEIEDNRPSNYEGSKVTTVIGSGHGRQRYQRIVSPRRGRYNHNNNNNNNNNNDNRFNRRQGSARCLLLTHVPLECNEESKLRRHFCAFGKVTGVQVGFQGDQHHALIEFATNEHARAAFRSPLPILDNRFIRTSLFARSTDSNNLTVCKDSSDDENRKRRKVVPCNGADEFDSTVSGEESVSGQWGRHRQISESDNRTVTNVEETRRVEIRESKWPIASDLKLDRRPSESESKPVIKPNEIKSKVVEAKKDRDVKMQLLNERQEMKNRINKVEESVQSCKTRLKSLLEEQKQPDCDQELTKQRLYESWNYFKYLKAMLEPLKKKYALLPDLSEEDKLKLNIMNIQNELANMDKNEEEYRKKLKSITEMKRELVNLQTISKKTTKRPTKLPSIIETKLDNRPKTLYLIGSQIISLDEARNLFKFYQVEKLELSNETNFISVKLKTRREADKAFKEMSKILKEKNISLSFEKPVTICDPLDFKTRQSETIETQRGTPSRRDECASSDDDEESKLN